MRTVGWVVKSYGAYRAKLTYFHLWTDRRDEAFIFPSVRAARDFKVLNARVFRITARRVR